MDAPFLYYPVKQPIDQNNLFGQTSPMYTALGQKGHPGIDFECPSGTPVYSPCDGAAFYVTDVDGGCGLWIRTPDAPNPQFAIILWHMYPKDTPGFPYAIPTGEGIVTDVKAGQLLGYSDNTGYPKESTGPHLHVGVMPLNAQETALNPDNGYLGCVDPTPYFNGQFAEDINTPPPVPTPQAIQDASQVVSLVAQSTNIPLPVKQTILQEILAILEKYL